MLQIRDNGDMTAPGILQHAHKQYHEYEIVSVAVEDRS